MHATIRYTYHKILVLRKLPYRALKINIAIVIMLRQTDRQINRQTDKQPNRQTDRQTNRQTCRSSANFVSAGQKIIWVQKYFGSKTIFRLDLTCHNLT